MYGRTECGTLNAVYALLKQVYGLEFYTDTVYEFDYSVPFDYFSVENTVFNPSIDNAWAMDGAVSSNDSGTVNWEYQRRMGFVNSWQVYNGTPHNFLDAVPPYETYGAAHSDWYYEATATDSGRKFVTLCLASGGEEMAKAVAEYAYTTIIAQDAEGNKKDCFFFGPPDARGWCECAKCDALKSKYGSHAGGYVLFMNSVAKTFDENYSVGRKIKFYMMAYNAVLQAPDYSDELKFYSSDKVSLCVMYAPIEADFGRDFSDDSTIGAYGKTNAYYLRQYENWQKFGGEVSLWRYSARFDNYFVPSDSISSMQSVYRAAAKYSADNFADQGVSGTTVAANFNALKIYLKSKLAKNVNEDIDTLIKNFCNAYYGAAGEKMYAFLLAEQAWLKTLSEKVKEDTGADKTGCHIICNSDLFNAKYWDDTPSGVLIKKYDASMLKGWYRDYIEAALDLVAENSEYAKRIRIEGIAVRYMIYAVYNDDSYGDFSRIAADAKLLGITRFAEGNSFTNTESYERDGTIDNLS